MGSVSRLALSQMIAARLATVPHATGYVGEVLNDDGTTLPPLGPSGRIAPYWVLLSGDGSPIDDLPLSADPTGSLSWRFQVRAGAGFHDDTLNVVDQVHTLLDGWIPTLGGYQFGPILSPPGYDPGPVRRLEQVEPPRYFLPCQFVLNTALA
jgi:hypothetical protein